MLVILKAGCDEQETKNVIEKLAGWHVTAYPVTNQGRQRRRTSTRSLG